MSFSKKRKKFLGGVGKKTRGGGQSCWSMYLILLVFVGFGRVEFVELSITRATTRPQNKKVQNSCLHRQAAWRAFCIYCKRCANLLARGLHVVAQIAGALCKPRAKLSLCTAKCTELTQNWANFGKKTWKAVSWHEVCPTYSHCIFVAHLSKHYTLSTVYSALFCARLACSLQCLSITKATDCLSNKGNCMQNSTLIAKQMLYTACIFTLLMYGVSMAQLDAELTYNLILSGIQK